MSFAQLISRGGHSRPPSNHFDERKFRNPGANARGFLDFLRWMSTRRRGRWPRWIPVEAREKPAARVEDLRVTFVNHSTVLVQTAGVNVLTDPVWSERVSPFSWVGPRRHHAPGIAFDDLPPIDLVLVSHNHYDHLDLATLERLFRRDRPRVAAALGNRALLESRGIACDAELDWWQSAPAGPLTVTCVPAQHFSGRGLRDRNRTLWCGFVVSGPAGELYFAGDTGYGDLFRRIGARFPRLRLALLPIGAYRPEWFMSPVHLSPAQAFQAHRELAAATSVGIHFGTFELADDAEAEPGFEIGRLLAEAPEPKPRFWVLRPGEARDVPRREEEDQAS